MKVLSSPVQSGTRDERKPREIPVCGVTLESLEEKRNDFTMGETPIFVLHGSK